MINLNKINPPALPGTTNVTWQSDVSGNVSACLAVATPAKLIVTSVANVLTLDASLASSFLVTLHENVTTLNVINPLGDGQEIVVLWQQDATGGRTVTFPGNVNGGLPPVAAINALSNQTFTYNLTDTTWYPATGQNVLAAQMPALTGDITSTAGTAVTTVAKIQGVAVAGTSGTNNVAFTTSPTFVTPTLGVASGSSLALTGATSGTVTIKPQAVAGTWEFDLPITAGTAGQVLTSQGGAGTPMTWSAGGSGITTLTGDVTASGSGSVAATVAKIQGTTVSGTTGTTNAVFSASPALTGTPTAPTATVGTNTTQLATTAFVAAATPTLTGDVTSVGAATTVAKVQGTTVSGTTGTTNVVFSTSPTLTTPTVGTSLALTGSSSGTITIKPQAAAGTYEFDLPITVGTAGQVLTSQGGAGTAMTWTTPGSGITALTGDVTGTGPGSTAATVAKIQGTTVTGTTGTGAVVLANTPTLITPVLGAATGTSLVNSGNVTGSQIISTVAIGTAPLTVTSTTNVPNLNASTLSGATFAAPGAIGGTTPAAATFTTATANTSLVINGGTALTTTNQTGTGSLVLAAGPTFTGVPAAPTATVGTNTTQLATTAFAAAVVPASGSVLWNALGNAGGALTLANGTNASTFNHTSNAAWTLANTTAATVTTPQNSPTLALSGQYWATGAVTGTDSWTLSQTIAAGLNGKSTLSLTHAGSTGAAQVLFPVGANALPPISFIANPDTGIVNFSGSLGIQSTSAGWCTFSSTGIQMRNGDMLGWAPGNTQVSAASDTSIGRASAPGVLRINNIGSVSGGQLSTGSILLVQSNSATISAVTPTLGSASTWGYKIVAKDINGNPTAVSAQVTTATGAATLDATHFNTITWSASNGAFSYDIYRTAVATSPTTLGKLGNVLSTVTLSFVDNAVAGDSTTAPTVNLTGSISIPGTVTKYTNIATVGKGIAAEYATVDLTAQAAAIAATTAYAVPATGGMYRVTWVATVTTAATTSSVLGGTAGFQMLYTDFDTSVVKTMPGSVVAGIETNSTNSTSTGTISGSFAMYAAPSTNIQYQMDYTSVGVTAMQYNLHIRIEGM